MRPLIDTNNLSHSQEFLIYYSRSNIVMRAALLIGTAIAVIYFYIENKPWIVLLLLGLFIFQIPYLIRFIKSIDDIQFRINAEGIQYQNNMLVSWDKIENERVETEYDKENEGTDYFIYFIKDTGQVMKFSLEDLSTSRGELQIVLTVNRNRFNKESIA
ncbi:hypothetical protein ACFFLS_03400 [Flavobacterium procerum]|uniref:YcxB-like protein domain-containing protein n=1 Tax=Flavobacterium procerum TaxID=1455569 RepID=A0ABV6BKV2_9FLAO